MSTAMERPDRKAIEEASAWLALLHGPRRRENIAQGFRRWEAERPEHAAAFQAVTAMWELTEGLEKRPLPLSPGWAQRGFRSGMRRGLAIAAGVALVTVLGGLWYLRHPGVATGVGEQRMLTLADGSRVYLNTNTRLRVAYSAERRGIELQEGEALFEVAKGAAGRPFVVMSGAREVVALATAFVVRQDVDVFTVTTVEGKVAVGPLGESQPVAGSAGAGRRTILSAGERLTLEPKAAPRIDKPIMDKVTAWRQGRVELRDTPLREAVREMNRYSAVTLVVEKSVAMNIPVTGAFRAGDSVSFAESVASSCELKVVRAGDELLIAGEPAEDCR